MIQVIGFTKEELMVFVEDVVRSTLEKNSDPVAPKTYIKGIHELAAFLKVSPPRAQKLKNEGVFPYFQNGRLVLFDQDKVREAMANYNQSKKRR